MGTNISAPKKERNYLIDVVKIIATILCVGAHYGGVQSGLFGTSGSVSFLTPTFQYSYLYQHPVTLLGCAGYITIAFFTFTTGYWFMNAFQRTKKTGVFGKGKDGTILFRYWARNYATYWPYILVGSLFSIFFIYFMTPELRTNFASLIDHLILSIPAIFGFHGLGITDNIGGTTDLRVAAQLTENFTLPFSEVFYEWNGPLWYMYGLIAWFALVYFVFMKSETFGLAVFCPIMYAVYNLFYHVGSIAWTFYEYDSVFFRLIGPATLGIYGWYVVNALKKHEFTKSESNLLTVVAVGSFAVTVYGIITSTGGFVLQDYGMAIFLTTVMLQKDPFTVALNKASKYFPFIKHANVISLCIFSLHKPMLDWAIWAIEQPRYADIVAKIQQVFNPDTLFLAYLAFLFVICIPFYFLDKYVLKRITNWILTATKANEPVVIEAPKAEA